jgi:hypothetical protein
MNRARKLFRAMSDSEVKIGIAQLDIEIEAMAAMLLDLRQQRRRLRMSLANRRRMLTHPELYNKMREGMRRANERRRQEASA